MLQLSEPEKRLCARLMAKNLISMLAQQEPFLTDEQIVDTLSHISELITFGASRNE